MILDLAASTTTNVSEHEVHVLAFPKIVFDANVQLVHGLPARQR